MKVFHSLSRKMTLQYYLHLGEKLTKAQHKPRLLAIMLTAMCYNYFRHVHSMTLGGRVLNMNEQKVSITGLKKTKNKISGSDVFRKTEWASRAAVKSCCSNSSSIRNIQLWSDYAGS